MTQNTPPLHKSDKRVIDSNNWSDLFGFAAQNTYQGAILRDPLPPELRQEFFNILALKSMGRSTTTLPLYWEGSSFTPMAPADKIHAISPHLLPFILKVANCLWPENTTQLGFQIMGNIFARAPMVGGFHYDGNPNKATAMTHAVLSFDLGKAPQTQWVDFKGLTHKDREYFKQYTGPIKSTHGLAKNVHSVNHGDLFAMKGQCQGNKQSGSGGIMHRANSQAKNKLTLTWHCQP